MLSKLAPGQWWPKPRFPDVALPIGNNSITAALQRRPRFQSEYLGGTGFTGNRSTPVLAVTSISAVSPHPRTAAVSSVEVTFNSEPVAIASFTNAALMPDGQRRRPTLDHERRHDRRGLGHEFELVFRSAAFAGVDRVPREATPWSSTQRTPRTRTDSPAPAPCPPLG